jgi:mannose-6-phosphate isomerase-like protein (cupin superfamily)
MAARCARGARHPRTIRPVVCDVAAAARKADSMHASCASLMSRLPGPDGERFVQALAHGSMTVELYAPVGTDPQLPHEQDELYFIIAGSGDFVCGAERTPFAANMVFFVPAGVVHRFEHFSPDFATWVVFWGPGGGEP